MLAAISFMVLLLLPAVAQGVSCGTAVRPIFEGWAGDLVFECEQQFVWRWAGMVVVWLLAVTAAFLVVRDPQFADDPTPLADTDPEEVAKVKEFVDKIGK